MFFGFPGQLPGFPLRVLNLIGKKNHGYTFGLDVYHVYANNLGIFNMNGFQKVSNTYAYCSSNAAPLQPLFHLSQKERVQLVIL